jgi:hypothetical protein
MATVTARRASQALDGQSVFVLLNAADSAQLANMSINQGVTFDGKTGYICSIDIYGHSFKMNPAQLNKNLSSSGVPGYLANGEVLTLL